MPRRPSKVTKARALSVEGRSDWRDCKSITGNSVMRRVCSGAPRQEVAGPARLALLLKTTRKRNESAKAADLPGMRRTAALARPRLSLSTDSGNAGGRANAGRARFRDKFARRARRRPVVLFFLVAARVRDGRRAAANRPRAA